MTMLAALLLAPTPMPTLTPTWLAGAWVPLSEASRQDAAACDGEDVRVWRRDGSLSGDGGGGGAAWWRLDGARLVEAGGDADESAVSIVRRLGPDPMRVTAADGEQVEWRRCR